MDIGSLIQKATKEPPNGTNILVVSASLLAPIKNLCKKDEQSLLSAFHYLSVDLKRKNGCVRMRSLYIINELFQRSKVFRKEVSQNITTVVSCSGLLRSLTNDVDGGIASSFAVEIENKVKELIETWDSTYGTLYPEIHAVARYFRETLKLQMPNIAVWFINYYVMSLIKRVGEKKTSRGRSPSEGGEGTKRSLASRLQNCRGFALLNGASDQYYQSNRGVLQYFVSSSIQRGSGF